MPLFEDLHLIAFKRGHFFPPLSQYFESIQFIKRNCNARDVRSNSVGKSMGFFVMCVF